MSQIKPTSKVIIRAWDQPVATHRSGWPVVFHVDSECRHLRSARSRTTAKTLVEKRVSIERAVGGGWRPCSACAADAEVEALVSRLAFGADQGVTADPEELNKRVRRLMKRRRLKRPKGQRRPRRRAGAGGTSDFERSAAVKAWVLMKANGRCELCRRKAPFVDGYGFHYLELHHVLRLADGGPDTPENAVALCPNCHRRCHHAADREEATERLYETVKRLLRE